MTILAFEEANEIHEMKLIIHKMDTKINIILGIGTATFLSFLAKAIG
jgi:hypothetical protein